MGRGTEDSDGPARGRRAPRPLDEERLRELALHYVGRFATTRAKLAAYLNRKLRERGWAGEGAPDLHVLVERLAELGYIDDRAFGVAKAGSLTARGYGTRRVHQALKLAGVTDEDAVDGAAVAEERAADAALRYASRRRIGPFALEPHDPVQREKALAAMIRAGHDFALARAIVDAKPGIPPDL
ncbi:RecX family transcriptional regulator [Sphingomonas sp. BN140010]|uniref:RecX family transcriptional regulator n=1 Tax=Sphingomonas arvum TaxID=2992113 RepID=A0ABT3JGK3_9SPHN|nr:RecX family transcriptional regulator [Sphingomonas sp. BN140010]MCW3798213.1 RecX family transcriptional regulator [Sphingomonas sp. BN140010]